MRTEQLTMANTSAQRRRVLITVVILSIVAIGFYIATFVRHWS